MPIKSEAISNLEESVFAHKLNTELDRILHFWRTHARDIVHGGFIGRMDNENKVYGEAPKGIILNTRILWTFSRACNFYKDSRYDEECQRAFDYLRENFQDYENGGVFWMLDHRGNPLDKRKQVYAQAFCIYALSEYYKYSKNPKALLWALELFEILENKALDKTDGGYWEAFGHKWNTIADMRLSEKDLNAPKTTNTHLHILEAYTTLWEVSQNQSVEKALVSLIRLFLSKVFEYCNHMKLFFSKDWKKLSSEISFGHDIEAAWLILYATRILDDKTLIKEAEVLLKNVCKTFINEALDSEFGVINAKDSNTFEIDTDRHWWPQAEAMVGLLYNWKITNDPNYFNISKQIWEFIDTHIINHKYGEWFFRVNQNGLPYLHENKIGPWKCPYHNSRALMEILQLLG